MIKVKKQSKNKKCFEKSFASHEKSQFWSNKNGDIKPYDLKSLVLGNVKQLSLEKSGVGKRQAVINPENTVYSIKRFMGRHFDEVETERKTVSYQVVQGPSNDARVRIPQMKTDFTPTGYLSDDPCKVKTRC
jgi:hypothetical protein